MANLIPKLLAENNAHSTVFSHKNWFVQCKDKSCSDLKELMKSCKSLTNWEQEFLSNIIFNRPLLGSRIYMTEKQKIVYNKIFQNKLRV